MKYHLGEKILMADLKKIEQINITPELEKAILLKEKDAVNLFEKLKLSYKKICFASSMGAEDMVIYYILNEYNFEFKIFTLDTGRLPPETYDLIASVNSKFRKKIEIFFPDSSQVKTYVDAKGINGFYNSLESRKECCKIRKIEPLKKALNGHDAWITGLRSEQSITRIDNKLIEKDTAFNIDKISPLINWSENEIWAYIKMHNIPYNTLHDKFYPSIGCAPCTRPISIGEDVRAGRWWWENAENKECGLHKKES